MLKTLRAAALVLATTAAVTTALAQETTEVTVDKLKLAIPKTWKQEDLSSSLRLAQFSFPPAEGETERGELAIFPPFGGTNQQNIERWQKDFDANDRTVKLTSGSTSQGDYVFAEMSGTFMKPEGPPVLQKKKATPGYRMYGVIFNVKGTGNYFLKLTGPDKTVAAQADAFRVSFGGKAADEKEYKPQ